MGTSVWPLIVLPDPVARATGMISSRQRRPLKMP